MLSLGRSSIPLPDRPTAGASFGELPSADPGRRSARATVSGRGRHPFVEAPE